MYVPDMNTENNLGGKGQEETALKPQVFRPSPRLKLLYLTYLFFVVWAFIMPCLMVITITYPPGTSLIFSVAALVVIIIALIWIRKYCQSIHYDFSAGRITRYHGVLSRQSVSIPCDQVHRVSSRKGPFQRLFGFGTVDLLTTDPAARDGSRILLSINGVANPEALEKMIDSCRTGKIPG